MLQVARARGLHNGVCGDATRLPFADQSFDCVFIGYGLRNFPSLESALHEIERVTRPGGLLVTLDFFLPANRLFRRLYLGYLYGQGALWGTLLHGRPRTYTYIPDSLRSFVSMDEFSAALGRRGYALIDTRAFLFGGIGLHWAVKR
jgi:demethylmenaquinone methyltransferase/2-methoxy-6-polyprenyl-1,4-benzoquinol methylase